MKKSLNQSRCKHKLNKLKFQISTKKTFTMADDKSVLAIKVDKERLDCCSL